MHKTFGSDATSSIVVRKDAQIWEMCIVRSVTVIWFRLRGFNTFHPRRDHLPSVFESPIVLEGVLVVGVPYLIFPVVSSKRQLEPIRGFGSTCPF